MQTEGSQYVQIMQGLHQASTFVYQTTFQHAQMNRPGETGLGPRLPSNIHARKHSQLLITVCKCRSLALSDAAKLSLSMQSTTLLKNKDKRDSVLQLHKRDQLQDLNGKMASLKAEACLPFAGQGMQG